MDFVHYLAQDLALVEFTSYYLIDRGGISLGLIIIIVPKGYDRKIQSLWCYRCFASDPKGQLDPLVLDQSFALERMAQQLIDLSGLFRIEAILIPAYLVDCNKNIIIFIKEINFEFN